MMIDLKIIKKKFINFKKVIIFKSKVLVYKFIFLNIYDILIRKSIGNRTLVPSKFPFELYELINNKNKDNKFYKNKIILPYKNINIYQRSDINLPYEVLEAKILKANNIIDIYFDKTKSLVIPMALLDKDGFKANDTYRLELSFNGKKSNLELKHLNRFHYLPIRAENYFNTLKVISKNSQPMAIGKPIILKEKKEYKPKLIIHLHVDALPQSIIDKYGMEIMPNTKKFFEERGTCFTNAYAQADWTLPSVACTFTGKYTNEHLLYHPKNKYDITSKTIANTLKENNYRTFACTSVPRISPATSFDKGFDRFVLAPYKNQDYIINEALEQLKSFNCNQYIFLAFMDIHEAHQLQPMSTQIACDLKDFQFRKLKIRNMIDYDHERIRLLHNTLSHFDTKLEVLYKAINEYDKNAIVILHSDHGVSFMSKTDQLLAKERQKIIFLYKNGSKSKYSSEIKELRDLPSMICNDLEIKHSFIHNKRDYAITECLYPQRNYEVSVRSNNYVLFFKVPWKNIMKKNIDKYISSIHPIENEEKELTNEIPEYNTLLQIAKDHTLELFKNI